MPKFVFSGKQVVEKSVTPYGWNLCAPATVQSNLPRVVEVTKFKQSKKRPAEAVDDQSLKRPHVKPGSDDEPWDNCVCGKKDGCVKCWRTALDGQLAKHGIDKSNPPTAGCAKCMYLKKGCKWCIKKNVLELKGAGKRRGKGRGKGRGNRGGRGRGRGCGRGRGKGCEEANESEEGRGKG